MNTLDKTYVEQAFEDSKETLLFGRYITLQDIQKTFSKYRGLDHVEIKEIGYSEQNRSIFEFQLGTGEKKILIWTQMHGNESTGTKAVFDLFKMLADTKDTTTESILTNCAIKVIPIVNPDGAEKYTRVNANQIDLNRDAVDKFAAESKLLRKTLDDFQPDFCFNMHDQRTIFGVKGTKNPATLSFLAPSEEESRSITKTRKKTMNVIVAMNSLMQKIIPNHIGRYTDEFYPTATGDNFQKLGYPTILIESGHFKEDYEREEVRKFTFQALLQGIYHIASTSVFNDFEDYFTIPDNTKNFRDLLHCYNDGRKKAFQYEEIMKEGKLNFDPKEVNEDISQLLFHKEIDFVN